MAHGKTCPYCGSLRTYLVQGQEVMVKEIETPDEQYSRDGAAREASPDPVDAANPLIIE